MHCAGDGVAASAASEVRFRDGTVGPIYGRYKRFGSIEIEESFFPVLWSEDGRRSQFLIDYLA